MLPATFQHASVIMCVSVLVAAAVSCGGSRPNAGSRTLLGIPEAQRDILADGTVSAAEYEQAAFATLQCLDEHGVEYTEPEWVEHLDGYRTLQYGMLFPPGSDRGIYDQCFDEYQREVETAYVTQHAPSEEVRQQRVGHVIACMNERGHAITDTSQIPGLTAGNEAASRDAISCQSLAFQGHDPFADPTPGTPDLPDAGVPPAALVELVPELSKTWATVSAFQRDLLSDGELTRGEYEVALSGFVGCLQEVGFEDVGVRQHPTGKYRMFGGASWSSSSEPDMKLLPGETPTQAMQRCEREFYSIVYLVNEAIFAPSPEELASAESWVRACVAQYFDEEVGTAEFYDAVTAADEQDRMAAFDCAHDYARQHGVYWEIPAYEPTTERTR